MIRKMNLSNMLMMFGLAIVSILAIMPESAHAITAPTGAGGTGSMPWLGPLDKIRLAMTGPTALAIGLIAIAVAGAMLIFGGEINAFARTAIYIVLVLGLLITANAFLTGLAFTGATVPQDLVCYANSVTYK